MKAFKLFLMTIFVSIFCHLGGFSQNSSVSGLVVDSDSLYSVSNVTVFLLDANQKVVTRVATNSKGMFVISSVLRGIYKIRVIASGYKVMISKQFVVASTTPKYNFKIKINNLEAGEANAFSEQDYNEYLDLLEDREVLSEDK